MTRIYPASSGRGLRRAHTNKRKGGRELRVFARRSCGPPSLRDKQTPSGCSLRSARIFGYELRASAAGGCGPLGPIGPILTQNQPAAERTGLLSSSARLQPSAQGRLRAAAPYGRKFRIQNSKFKMTRIYPASSGRGLRRARTNGRKSGHELRASAGRRLQPSVASRRTDTLGQQPAERTQIRERVAGLRRAEAAARSVLTDRS